MGLADTLGADLKAAMKAGDTTARQCLRMAMSALKNRRIELGRDLEEAEEIAVIQKELKKRADAAEQFEAAGRGELAENERAEAAVLSRYVPSQLTEDEVRSVVKETIDALGLTSKKELGQLMKAVLAEHRGRVDGKLVQRIASELLA
ncbi:MAG TPA: GatB/YqeY domain-containing protein [Planctomycetes bacterium]|nr:GatB/YqeY domain-containing protein [Planctomycetota bacterium]